MVFKLYSKALVCGLAVILLSAPSFAQKKSKNKNVVPPKEKLFSSGLAGDPNNSGTDYYYKIKGDSIYIYPVYPQICEKMFRDVHKTETQKEIASDAKYQIVNKEFIIAYPPVMDPDHPHEAKVPSPVVAYFVAGPSQDNVPDQDPDCLRTIIFTSKDQMDDARMYFFEKVFESNEEVENGLSSDKDKKITSTQRIYIALTSLIDSVDRMMNPDTSQNIKQKRQN